MKTTRPTQTARPSRRTFLEAAGVLSAGALAPRLPGGWPDEVSAALPTAFSGLKPLGDRVHPITPDEFGARIEHAQTLMGDPG